MFKDVAVAKTVVHRYRFWFDQCWPFAKDRETLEFLAMASESHQPWDMCQMWLESFRGVTGLRHIRSYNLVIGLNKRQYEMDL